MSWFKENYHVAALGGGVLVLAGLGYTSLSAKQAVVEEFATPISGQGKTTTVEGVEELQALDKSLEGSSSIALSKTATNRPVQLFTSVDLFVEDGKPNDLKDLLTMNEDVHPPIPNQWWVDNMLDPTWFDSPQRDKDGDGFTNLEEFEAKTDPNDDESYGDVITKLKVAEVKSTVWRLEFNSVLGKGFQFNLLFKEPGGPVQNNRMAANDAIEAGDFFFKEGVGKERFKLLKVEPRPMQTATGQRDVPFAIVEDQLENKKGDVYELQFGMKQAQLLKSTRYDHTVSFYLDAIGESGNKFDVVENGTFALPSSGADKNYKLTKVNLDSENKPESVEVQGPAGPITIPVE